MDLGLISVRPPPHYTRDRLSGSISTFKVTILDIPVISQRNGGDAPAQRPYSQHPSPGFRRHMGRADQATGRGPDREGPSQAYPFIFWYSDIMR